MLSLMNEMVKKYKLPYIFQEQRISSFCEDDYSLNEMNTKMVTLILYLFLSLFLCQPLFFLFVCVCVIQPKPESRGLCQRKYGLF